jgi:CO/xanthine dehydrogenase FAD-binding subunit
MKSTCGAEAKFWAGGTDMMPLWQRESVEFDYYIDLTPLSELNFVEADENEIRIGAMATLGALDRASDPNNLTQELKTKLLAGRYVVQTSGFAKAWLSMRRPERL